MILFLTFSYQDWILIINFLREFKPLIIMFPFLRFFSQGRLLSNVKIIKIILIININIIIVTILCLLLSDLRLFQIFIQNLKLSKYPLLLDVSRNGNILLSFELLSKQIRKYFSLLLGFGDINVWTYWWYVDLHLASGVGFGWFLLHLIPCFIGILWLQLFKLVIILVAIVFITLCILFVLCFCQGRWMKHVRILFYHIGLTFLWYLLQTHFL